MYVSAIQGQHLNWSLSAAKLSSIKEGPQYAAAISAYQSALKKIHICHIIH